MIWIYFCLCAKDCNEVKDRYPTVNLFCLRSHAKNENEAKKQVGIPWVFTHGILIMGVDTFDKKRLFNQ